MDLDTKGPPSVSSELWEKVWVEEHEGQWHLCLGDWAGSLHLEMKSRELALDACGWIRSTIGDACRKPLEARVSNLTQKYLGDDGFSEIVCVAHSQGQTTGAFIAEAARNAAKNIQRKK